MEAVRNRDIACRLPYTGSHPGELGMCSNNLPLDIFGLYREVIGVGGFTNNERYDDTNRWKGGINFAGEVFPKMRNWTAGNRATSVGNQLHTNYRKFLLAYELAHRVVDLGLPPDPLPGGGPKVFFKIQNLPLAHPGKMCILLPGPIHGFKSTASNKCSGWEEPRAF